MWPQQDALVRPRRHRTRRLLQILHLKPLPRQQPRHPLQPQRPRQPQRPTAPPPPPPPPPPPSPSGGATSLTVLFFYDPSCPHCQAIEGQVQNIPTYGGKVSVQWVDTTTQSGYNELHSYGATEIPTFVILNGGSEVGSPLVGPTVQIN